MADTAIPTATITSATAEIQRNGAAMAAMTAGQGRTTHHGQQRIQPVRAGHPERGGRADPG